MQTNTAAGHHLTPGITAAIKKVTRSKRGTKCGERGASYTLGGNADCTATVQNRLTFPQKTKTKTTT